MNLKDLQEKVRRFEIDGLTIECEKSCSDCHYLADCKKIEKETLKYKPSVRSFGAELYNRSTILPLIDSNSEKAARKLYQLLIEMEIADRMGKKWNALDIAKNLGIPVFRVRKRLEALVKRRFIKQVKNKYEFSFGRNVHSLVKFYGSEFQRRFGGVPRIDPKDVGVLAPLVKDYSDADLRVMITKYLQLNDQFLKDCGYSLRFFPNKINRLVMELGTRIPQKTSELTKDQLDEYLKCKTAGEWDGTEEWAAPYERALKALQIST